MTHKLKALGLALVAVFAMSAVVASAAHATAGKFRWDSGTTRITGREDGAEGSATARGQFTTTSGSIQCAGGHGEATVTGTEATELTSQAVQSTNCIGPFGEKATLEFGECDFLATAGETVGASETELTGTGHVVCPVGKQITLTGAGGFCQIHIGDQRPTGHFIAHTIAAQVGTGTEVTIEATVTGIVYQGTGLCTPGNTGQYKGNILVTIDQEVIDNVKLH